MNKYLIALSYLENLGPATAKKLINSLGSAETVFNSSAQSLIKAGLPVKLAQELSEQKAKLNPDELIRDLNQQGVNTVDFYEADYPDNLKNIHQPPLVLFYRGNQKLFQQTQALAVVGSRKISNYASALMPSLLEPVINKGITIVSGLAYGVDQLAHELALSHNGSTIAVLAGGVLDSDIYPKSNFSLAKKIIQQNGLLLSECPPNAGIRKFSFPKRNRIITGLSRAVLIIEAAQKSGALVSASFALEQNREVLAVPQNINGLNSYGVNELIKNGAKIVLEPWEILEEFGFNQPPPGAPNQESLGEALNLSPEEKLILNCLAGEPMHIDKITEQCNLESSDINVLLIKMELNGLIKNTGQQYYVKNF